LPVSASTMDQQVTNNAETIPSDSEVPATTDASTTDPNNPAADGPANDAAANAARREREARDRERERWRAGEGALVKPGPLPPTSSAKPKTTTVQVTYDEAGRVTQASGGDANALRIARQKRFPAGKAGSATVTIPVN
jgi:hypothetical protein